MSAETEDQDLHDLLASWAGADLSPERISELQQRLVSDPVFRATVTREIAFLGQLRAVHAPNPRWNELESIWGAPNEWASDFESQTMGKILAFRRVRRVLAWAATLLVFVAGAIWYFLNAPQQKEILNELAVLNYVDRDAPSDSGNAVFQRLGAGPFKVSEGMLQMRMLSGVTLTVTGPAELDLRSAMEVVVTAGKVVADVPPFAQGFTLRSGSWNLVDRGTVFAVDASEPLKPEVHVLEGKVETHRGSGVAGPVLTSGQALQLGDSRNAKPMPARPERFPDLAEVSRRVAQDRENRFRRWQRAADALAQDASLLIYYDFNTVDRGSNTLINRAPKPQNGSNGILVGGDWIEGRWPEKRAVRFQHPGDLVRALAQETLTDFSFLTWVRLDAEKIERPMSILLSPKVGSGQVYWLVWPYRSANPALGMHLTITADSLRDVAYPETATFSSPTLGRWVQLGAVQNWGSGRVQLFSNGVKVADLPIRESTQVRLEELVLGSWGYTKETKNFVGAMDELAIFRRAVSESEVAAFYANGRP